MIRHLMPRLKHWVNVGDTASIPAAPLTRSPLNRAAPATCPQCRLQHEARRRLLLGAVLLMGYAPSFLGPITMDMREFPCWLSDHEREGMSSRRTSNSWMWNRRPELLPGRGI